MRKRLEAPAPGLTPRAVRETLSGILMLDMHLPLADGRKLVLPRYTQPEPEHRLVLEKLGWQVAGPTAPAHPLATGPHPQKSQRQSQKWSENHLDRSPANQRLVFPPPPHP